jgi:hypothetical protein
MQRLRPLYWIAKADDILAKVERWEGRPPCRPIFLLPTRIEKSDGTEAVPRVNKCQSGSDRLATANSDRSERHVISGTVH